MHHPPLVRTRPNNLHRAAIVIIIVVCGLSACVADEPSAAMSGSSTPPHRAWTHTSNEPNWMGASYTAH